MAALQSPSQEKPASEFKKKGLVAAREKLRGGQLFLVGYNKILAEQ